MFLELSNSILSPTGVPTVKHSTAELLRRQNAGEALEDTEPKETMPRGKNTWPGNKLPTQHFGIFPYQVECGIWLTVMAGV